MMTDLATFTAALRARLDQARWAPGVPEAAIGALRRHLQKAPEPTGLAACENPVSDIFNAAMAHAFDDAETALDRRLLRAFQAFAGDLVWYRRSTDPSTPFHHAHANAEIIGRRGLGDIDGISVGLSVLAPATVYPDHHHPPEEVYLVLSPGEWRQNEGAWWEPGYGGYVYNPPDIVHAMRTGDAPLLAIWCLHH